MTQREAVAAIPEKPAFPVLESEACHAPQAAEKGAMDEVMKRKSVADLRMAEKAAADARAAFLAAKAPGNGAEALAAARAALARAMLSLKSARRRAQYWEDGEASRKSGREKRARMRAEKADPAIAAAKEAERERKRQEREQERQELAAERERKRQERERMQRKRLAEDAERERKRQERERMRAERAAAERRRREAAEREASLREAQRRADAEAKARRKRGKLEAALARRGETMEERNARLAKQREYMQAWRAGGDMRFAPVTRDMMRRINEALAEDHARYLATQSTPSGLPPWWFDPFWDLPPLAFDYCMDAAAAARLP